ncbi:hypothetical protein DFJ73DRAFT_920288 [Zopfochytrium polystomum]|nr:hypothetical protein DFJ73DRAFT_920288 [Zopfochytrium polystomum]
MPLPPLAPPPDPFADPHPPSSFYNNAQSTSSVYTHQPVISAATDGTTANSVHPSLYPPPTLPAPTAQFVPTASQPFPPTVAVTAPHLNLEKKSYSKLFCIGVSMQCAMICCCLLLGMGGLIYPLYLLIRNKVSLESPPPPITRTLFQIRLAETTQCLNAMAFAACEGRPNNQTSVQVFSRWPDWGQWVHVSSNKCLSFENKTSVILTTCKVDTPSKKLSYDGGTIRSQSGGCLTSSLATSGTSMGGLDRTAFQHPLYLLLTLPYARTRTRSNAIIPALRLPASFPVLVPAFLFARLDCGLVHSRKFSEAVSSGVWPLRKLRYYIKHRRKRNIIPNRTYRAAENMGLRSANDTAAIKRSQPRAFLRWITAAALTAAVACCIVALLSAPISLAVAAPVPGQLPAPAPHAVASQQPPWPGGYLHFPLRSPTRSDTGPPLHFIFPTLHVVFRRTCEYNDAVYRRANPNSAASSSSSPAPLKSALKKPNALKDDVAAGKDDRKITWSDEVQVHQSYLTQDELRSRREHALKIQAKMPKAWKDVAKDEKRQKRPFKDQLGIGPKFHSYVAPEAAKHTPPKLKGRKRSA